MRHRHTTPFEMCEIKYAREAADFFVASPVDPPPHRQFERVVRALLDPRQLNSTFQGLSIVSAQSRPTARVRDAVLAGKGPSGVRDLKKYAELVYDTRWKC